MGRSTENRDICLKKNILWFKEICSAEKSSLCFSDVNGHDWMDVGIIIKEIRRFTWVFADDSLQLPDFLHNLLRCQTIQQGIMGYKKRARDRFTACSLVCRHRGWIYGGVLDVTKKHAAGGVAECQRRFWKDEEYEGEFLFFRIAAIT